MARSSRLLVLVDEHAIWLVRKEALELLLLLLDDGLFFDKVGRVVMEHDHDERACHCEQEEEDPLVDWVRHLIVFFLNLNTFRHHLREREECQR